jgi:gliding motility-associated-like protein
LVQDENGCIEYLNGIEVKEPSSINATATIITQEICFGDNLGAFNVDIVGGTLPYSVSLIENGTYTAGTATQTQFSFTGLAGGPIKVFIKDANNCTSEITVAMNVPVNLDPIAIVEYGCVSNASTNTVTVTLDSNFTDEANVEYALDGSTTFQSIEVFTNVAPGTHTITARYILNGCEKITMPFTIDAIAPLAIALTDGGLNEIVATTTGGVGGYQYSVNGEDYGSTDKFIIYKTDDYTVTVTDSNGCTTSETKHMDFIEIIIPNVFTPNGDGSNDTWFPMNAENYKDISIYVFDRYGRKLGTFRQGQAWDGTYNGTELPSGDYWYVLKLNNYKDDREFVGNFTLYR